jgi:glycosyltransferase involved in cell wall biosynthesis
MLQPMISFVIPAHNEARLIGATLRALAVVRATLATSSEVVVVDDASCDATALIAREHGARVVSISARHIAAARNAGAAEALGEVLVFIDADTLVGPVAVHAALEALRAGAVGGGAAVRLDGPAAWYERAIERLLAPAFRWTGIAPGCFLFCTREAFEQVSGFDQRWYAGEDVAISKALARQGRFVILRHAVRTSARKLRTHSLGEHLRLLLRFARHGRGLLRSRAALDYWYGDRRP